MAKEFYARSGDPNKNRGPQTYRDHIEGVYRRCEENLKQILKYAHFKDEARRENFCQSLLQAARFHDLGKLEPENQRILSGNKRSSSLPYHHEDAGILYLRGGAPFSASLIAAHHRGLTDQSAEDERGSWKFRPYNTSDSTEEVQKANHIEAHYRGYLADHFSILGESEIDPSSDNLKKKGLTFRLALSCLADADYGDAAAYFQDDSLEADSRPTRWTERLEALDRYVQELSRSSADNEKQNQERNRDRADLYRECREKETNQDSVMIETCSSPVGTGKTTAVMARLLRMAAERGLRHIFVVLPFTNIIEQSVETYRKALVLPGEDAEEIVAAHHHLVEYKTPEDRERTRLWKAPIIVTTAVQFFETLAGNRPSRLRKLQELPGSAVFIDEVHAALPLAYWPVTLEWIKLLTSDWGCHFILGSGSLQKYWENPFLMSSGASGNFSHPSSPAQKRTISPEVFQEILSPNLQERLETREGERVHFQPESLAWDFNDLISQLKEDRGGSKLVVLNTVFSAASVADRLRELGVNVLHLSTALTPFDRKRILQKIRNRLNLTHSEYCGDWILVATSCVEAGVDFSFQKGYRESSTLTSLLQTAGRVNRHFEKEDAKVISFRLLQDEKLTLHPGFKFQQRILDELFEGGYFRKPLTEILKEELYRLVNSSEEILKAKTKLFEYEKFHQFKTMGEKYRLIFNPSKLVVVDEGLADRMAGGEKILFREIQEKSVQIWEDKIEKLNLPPIPNYQGIYRWQGRYDPDFLGYMTTETREKLKG